MKLTSIVPLLPLCALSLASAQTSQQAITPTLILRSVSDASGPDSLSDLGADVDLVGTALIVTSYGGVPGFQIHDLGLADPTVPTFKDAVGGSAAIAPAATNGNLFVWGRPSSGSFGRVIKRPPNQLEVIEPPVGQVGENFGSSVAFSGGTMIVGSPDYDSAMVNSGRVHVQTFGTGATTLTLEPDVPAVGERFGRSVDVDGSVAVVGARDAFYVFDLNTNTQLHRVAGPPNEEFGHAIAVDDGVVVVGAPMADASGIDAGLAYLFDVTTGAQIGAPLEPAFPTVARAGNRFGWDVDVSSTNVVVGAPNPGGRGAGWLFELAQNRRETELTNMQTQGLGESVAIDLATVVLGAPDFPNPGNDGAALVYSIFPATLVTEPGTGLNLDILTSDPVRLGQQWSVTVTPRAGRAPGFWILNVYEDLWPGPPFPMVDIGAILTGGLSPSGLSEVLFSGQLIIQYPVVFHSGGGLPSSTSHPIPNSVSLLGTSWGAQAIVWGAFPGGSPTSPTDERLSTAVGGTIGS